MDVTTFPALGRRVRRLILLALFASIAWCVLSLASAASSASASAGDEPQGSGLLGAVGSTVNGVGDLVAGTTGAVDEVLTSTVQSVAPATEPVVAPLPAPVTAPVAAVVDTATQTVGATVDHVDTTVVTVVDTAAATVADVANAEIVTGVVEPVTELVTDVPIVGSLVTSTGLDDTLVDVAHGVDGAVATVVGTAPPVDSILPDLPEGSVDIIVDELAPAGPSPLAPLPALLAPLTVSTAPAPLAPAADAASSAAVAFVVLPSRLLPGSASFASYAPATALPVPGTAAASGDPLWPGVRAAGLTPGGSASATGGSNAFGGSAGIPFEGADDSAAPFSTFHVHTDDTLPGAPVFDTDVAPD